MCWDALIDSKKNVLFLGTSGCGKSELAIDLALSTAETQRVQLFHLGQAKLLFRCLDVQDLLHSRYVTVHDAVDASTKPGSIIPKKMNPNHLVVMDITDNKDIGSYAQLFERRDSHVFYVINSLCPQNASISAADEEISSVLKAAQTDKIHFIANPNVGNATTSQDFWEGLRKTEEMLGPDVPIQAVFCPAWIYDEIREAVTLPLIPIHPRVYVSSENE